MRVTRGGRPPIVFPSHSVEFEFDSAITWSADDQPADVSAQVAEHLGAWVAGHTNLVMHIANPPDGVKCIALGRLPEQEPQDQTELRLITATGDVDRLKVTNMIVVDAHAPVGSDVTHIATLLLEFREGQTDKGRDEQTSRPSIESPTGERLNRIDEAINLLDALAAEDSEGMFAALCQGTIVQLRHIREHVAAGTESEISPPVRKAMTETIRTLEKYVNISLRVRGAYDLLRPLLDWFT